MIEPIGNLLCTRDDCGHQRAFHPRAYACRMPNCPCDMFVMPVEVKAEAMEPEPRLRRVAIDVPDGYTLTIQLVPVHAGEIIVAPAGDSDVQ